MVKLLITSYYGLRESLQSATNSLIKYGIIVVDFGLLKLYKSTEISDENKKLEFNNFIKKEQPDIILWWYINIPVEHMKYIVEDEDNSHIKHFYFNWDDPHNWSTNKLYERCKYFDHSFVCCEQSLPKYLEFGSKKASYLLPGYDPQIHKIIVFDDEKDVKKYSCDISFCCTNLYTDNNTFPNQYINRKELINNIYANQDKYGFTFHIYGPESLKELYPKSYKGYIRYDETNKLFNYSKINICTHVQCCAYKYLNERALLILGSGGLLYVDKVDGIETILEPSVDCVIIDKDNYLEQIRTILNNYDDYYMVRYNGHAKSIEYTWDKWANKINDAK